MKNLKSNKILIVVICLLGGFHTWAQDVYHVDPNQMHPLIPANLRNNLAHKIVVWNGYKRPSTVVTSPDGAKWDTISISNRDYKVFDVDLKLVKIYTNADNFKYYKLSSGKVYVVYYDRKQQVWEIVQE